MSFTRRAFLYLVGLAGLAPIGAQAMPPEPKTFSFCVGRPWEKSWLNPEGTSLCCYMYGDQVKHGTMADAEAFRQYVEEQTGKQSYIYKLVQVA